jgi:VanZ family protein
MTITLFFRWLAWLLIAAIAVITVSPLEFRLNTEASDMLERFLAFTVIVGVFCLGYPKHRLSIIVLVIAAIGLLEIAQKFVPGRHGRLLMDGVPKASGALFGAAIAVLIEQGTRRFKAIEKSYSE